MRKRLLSRVICLLACLPLLLAGASAEEPASFFDDVKADAVGKIIRTYDSPTLKYTMEKFVLEREICWLTRVWVQDPARQIRKAASDWKKNVKPPDILAKQIPEAALAVNGSGFVSPLYPEIPENYPGVSKDYHYTPLGSVTVTDGEVLRNLEGVPYFGLTLDEDGLQMYAGADNGDVLATGPSQTWSFYTGCPMMRDNMDILPDEWDFADRTAARTIIARADRNHYLILTATRERGKGISLRKAAAFFREKFDTEWVYNLDGGQSTALLARKRDKKNMRLITKKGAKIVDIMVFTE